ncbi:MAG: nitroreductase family deazaflavin-dependent oxidoreductase [Anaerolineales bacterium]|nr:nitroreductase family deazaflavin-dependent oxidoreductase [Anaerolineales bacterium]
MDRPYKCRGLWIEKEGVIVSGFASAPKFLLRLIHWPPQIAYALGLGPLLGRLVLLLTTTGRKSGKPRVVPLQYEEIDGRICLGSSRGLAADWVRNILADPNVTVRVKTRRFKGTAEVVTDSARIADFLEVRLRKHPGMVGAMIKGEGLSAKPERADLERYAAQIAIVVITPEK